MGAATAFEIEVPASTLALARTLERAPDATVQLERTVGSADDRATTPTWVSGLEEGRAEDLLAADPTVAAARRLGVDGDAELYDVEFDGGICQFAETIFDRGGAILRATATDGAWTIQLRFADSGDIAAVFDDELTQEYEATVTRLYGANDAPTVETGVTEKQRQALRNAFEMGYYDVPRTVDLRAVGDRLGISRQAVSERLRRGHELLVSDVLGKSDDER